jgi:phosphatidylserine/phosphatidylglycerophosphate/cardiolipin synthase-like enzyme
MAQDQFKEYEMGLLSREPPVQLSHREACVALGVPNTIRVPWDLPSDDETRWFAPRLTNVIGVRNKDGKVDWISRTLKASSDNEVTYLPDARTTFDAMGEELWSVVKDGNSNCFVYLLCWTLGLGTKMAGSGAEAFFTTASKQEKRIQVRVMYREPDTYQEKERYINASGFVNTLNALPGAAAILDRRIPAFFEPNSATRWNIGTHHQKIFVVYNGRKLTAFCGGHDIDPSRTEFWDVHCRIRGPAACELLQIFLDRWEDHPNHGKLDQVKGPLWGWDIVQRPPALPAPLPTQTRQRVLIGRTYANGKKHEGIDPSMPEISAFSAPVFKGYRFALDGEHTARDIILHAIGQARRFIYMEEQYLVDYIDHGQHISICSALADAVKNRLRHLTIVIPATTDLAQANRRRQAFIRRLKNAGGDKVRVFYRLEGQELKYVHSKAYIMDDEFAIIGSANCNRRSMSHDSEVVAAICDQHPRSVFGFTFAHRMRIGLWAQHLNMDPAELADGVASAAHWRSPLPAGAKVAPYDHEHNSHFEEGNLPAFVQLYFLRSSDDEKWSFIDPEGY